MNGLSIFFPFLPQSSKPHIFFVFQMNSKRLLIWFTPFKKTARWNNTSPTLKRIFKRRLLIYGFCPGIDHFTAYFVVFRPKGDKPPFQLTNPVFFAVINYSQHFLSGSNVI